jgi:hypothetical protein
LGPVQAYVAFDKFEVAFSVMPDTAQVRTPEAVADRLPGAVVFDVTVTLPDPVPEALVTVTVYVPAVDTTGLAAVEVNPLGPVQLYVLVPDGLTVSDKVVEGLLQVSTPLLVADAVTVSGVTVQGPTSLNTSYCSI